jgi:PKD repeat protein
MKQYQYINLLFLLLLASCAKEERINVAADFDITIVNNDYSVPVKVEIENKTTGADTYEWTFEGAVTTSSKDKDPKTVYYNTPGAYKIILKASNKDGASDEKSIEIQIDDAMLVDFDWQMQGSDISPVTLRMLNKSLGATHYLWEFEGGDPSTSTDEIPQVSFINEGDHTIKLTIANGRETYSTEKILSVKPAMTTDFDWSVDFVDQDYEAPVTLHMNNKSTNAASYEWTFPNNPAQVISTEQNPDITISTAGSYTLQMKAINDKESKIVQKQVTIHPDKNLLTFIDIRLGINTAHSETGCFFSSILGKTITKSEVNKTTGALIDFVYFGLDQSFGYNQFVSPDKAQEAAFEVIPHAIYTKVINSQELIGVQLSPAAFDAIVDGKDFANLNITETSKGMTPFNNTLNNRVVLFQTNDGRKGAIKITKYISDGKQSCILADIKVQKKP